MHREVLQHLLASDAPALNLGGTFLSVELLETILICLKVKGQIQIQNAGEVPSLFDLGAYLGEEYKHLKER
jgi:hypothetical protein